VNRVYAQSISPGNNTEDTKSNDDACLAMKDGSWQSSGRVEMPQSHGEGVVNVNGVGQTSTAKHMYSLRIFKRSAKHRPMRMLFYRTFTYVKRTLHRIIQSTLHQCWLNYIYWFP